MPHMPFQISVKLNTALAALKKELNLTDEELLERVLEKASVTKTIPGKLDSSWNVKVTKQPLTPPVREAPPVKAKQS